MSKEDVKKAIEDFENDEFVSSKETLTKIVRDKVKDHVNNKLGLEDDNEDNEEE